MCTSISDKLAVAGSAKGFKGWFRLDHAYVAYDHPTHAPFEHALAMDFVSEIDGYRVAIELDLESAHALARHLLDAIQRADALERA